MTGPVARVTPHERLGKHAALPLLPAADVPTVTRQQMREVDRLMVEEYGIQPLQMMENAGFNLADLLRRYLGASMCPPAWTSTPARQRARR